MRKVLSVLILLALMFLIILVFSGCKNVKITETNGYLSQQRSTNSEQYNSADDIITKVVTVDDLGVLQLPHDLLMSMSNLPDINFVRENIGIECLRDNGEVSYSIHKVKLTEGEVVYAFIIYDDGFVIDTWFVKSMPNKDNFLNIVEGVTTLDDIKKMDVATILYDENNPCTFHRFNDGTKMLINYVNKEGVLIVNDFSVDVDPVEIVDSLLTIDLKLLQ